jgi:hypothetical protein
MSVAEKNPPKERRRGVPQVQKTNMRRSLNRCHPLQRNTVRVLIGRWAAGLFLFFAHPENKKRQFSPALTN